MSYIQNIVTSCSFIQCDKSFICLHFSNIFFSSITFQVDSFYFYFLYLKNHSTILPVFQCSKTLVFSILYSFLHVYSNKGSPVTVSFVDTNGSLHVGFWWGCPLILPMTWQVCCMLYQALSCGESGDFSWCVKPSFFPVIEDPKVIKAVTFWFEPTSSCLTVQYCF